MRVRKLFLMLGLVLGAWLLAGAAPVPRKAPAFTFIGPAGQQTPLASFKGKVVAIEFLLTDCPHCWRLAQTLNKLQQELGPRGLQALGIALDKDLTAPRASDFAAKAAVSFPIGAATADQVDAFLGREAGERFRVPQLVVIDRAGVIRAQSHAIHEVSLEDEAHLRKLIADLLREETR
jgi:peroxiredoxin